MKIQFNIHFDTMPGQNICVCGSSEFLGTWDANHAIYMNYGINGNWSVMVEVPPGIDHFKYKYILKDDAGNSVWEWGLARKMDLADLDTPLLILQESWHSPRKKRYFMLLPLKNQVRPS